MRFLHVAVRALAIVFAYGGVGCLPITAGDSPSCYGVDIVIAQASLLEEVYARLKELENQNFGTVYDQEIVTQRLERLEKKVLGSAQKGSPRERLDRLLLNSSSSSTSAQQPASDRAQVILGPGSYLGPGSRISVGRGTTDISRAAGEPDFAPYEADLIRRLKRAWFPPRGAAGKTVRLVFKVQRGGELSNLEVVDSADGAVFDKAAVKAIENAAPFRPLPGGTPEEVTVLCNFADSGVSAYVRFPGRSAKPKNADLIPAKDFIGRQVEGKDLTEYFATAATKIKASWKSHGAATKPAAVGFHISKTGALEDIDMSEESGSSPFDESAKQAVLAAKTLDSPPTKEKIWTWAVFDNKSNDVAVGVPGDVDFESYMAAMQKKIKSGWLPPKSHESKRVTVQFRVDRTGKMSNLRVTKSAEAKIADDAAIKAAQNANPLPRLPRGAPAWVDIEFTFDYNVNFKKDSATKSSEAASEDE